MRLSVELTERCFAIVFTVVVSSQAVVEIWWKEGYIFRRFLHSRMELKLEIRVLEIWKFNPPVEK